MSSFETRAFLRPIMVVYVLSLSPILFSQTPRKETISPEVVKDTIAQKALEKDLIESGSPAERAGREVGTITLRDGTTYENAQVLNPTPAGIDVAYTIDGVDHVQFVSFEDLPPETRERFDYDPKKAKAYREYLAKLDESLRERRMREKENGRAQSPRERRLLNSIRQRGRKMILRVDRDLDNGVVGWAEPPDSHVTHRDLGDIFVYGYSAPNGAVRLGMLYPTDKYMHGYRAYAPTAAIAYWIATSPIGRTFGGF